MKLTSPDEAIAFAKNRDELLLQEGILDVCKDIQVHLKANLDVKSGKCRCTILVREVAHLHGALALYREQGWHTEYENMSISSNVFNVTLKLA